MNKPFAVLVGRLEKAAKIYTPDKGKPFVDATVWLDEREWAGKTYAQKVYVRSYLKDAFDNLAKFTEGSIVTVTGEADAQVETSKTNGKTYANLRVVGSISLVAGQPALRQSSANAASNETTTATSNHNSNEDAGDGVPF